jgi:hypothetical protein
MKHKEGCGYLYLRGEKYCGVNELDHTEKFYISHAYRIEKTPRRELLEAEIALRDAELAELKAENNKFETIRQILIDRAMVLEARLAEAEELLREGTERLVDWRGSNPKYAQWAIWNLADSAFVRKVEAFLSRSVRTKNPDIEEQFDAAEEERDARR